MSEATVAPGTTGQGDTPVTTAPVTTTTDPTTTAPEAPPAPWYEGALKKPETRGYAEVKKWADADAAIESYINLEKLRGVPAERLLTLPENLDDPAAVAPILEKLGYAPPKNADDYGFVTLEGVDPEFAKEAQSWMLEAGVTTKQAQLLAQKQVTWANERAAAEARDTEARHALEMDAYKRENGALHPQIEESAKRAYRQAGVTDEMAAEMMATVGPVAVWKMFAKVGEMIGESRFITPEQKGGEFQLSPAGAKAQLDLLRADRSFYEKLMSGNTEARTRWDNLNKIAAAGAEGIQ